MIVRAHFKITGKENFLLLKSDSNIMILWTDDLGYIDYHRVDFKGKMLIRKKQKQLQFFAQFSRPIKL